ncbi:MAG TPA: DNA adenine methylase [Solirubrobacterales bacterium]|nr:DNA adenine methylase [Solirubrobacterales bacterium]
MAFRYIGNKSRLVDRIVGAIRSTLPEGGRVADPMCGTATVAGGLADAGFSVTAADELTFAVLHARVRLLLEEAPPFAALGGYAEVLAELNSVPAQQQLFYREYSDSGSPSNGSRARAYFTGENAQRIDAIRATIGRWRDEGKLEDIEADLLHHDLIMAANRAANIAGTYGYYRSSWNKAALQPLVLLPTEFEGGGDHEVRQGKVEETIGEIEADAVYLDPPYTKRQYAGNYHILETLALGDEPEPVGMGGLRDWYDQYSDFCSKRSVRAAFETVLERVRAPWVFLSYSEDGLVPPAEMKALLGRFGEVEREDVVLPRFRSNGGRSEHVTEHLYRLRVA